MENITIMKKKVQDTQESLLKDNIRMNEEMKSLMEKNLKEQFYNLKQEMNSAKKEKKAKILLKAGMYDLGGNDVHSLIFYVTACKHKIDNLSFLKNVCKI